MIPGQSSYDGIDATPVYVISVAAQLSGMHPQTLRQYDRLGLVSPDRAPGRGRRYSARDIVRLREVQQLSAEGINLAGIKRIRELEDQVEALRARVSELERNLETALGSMSVYGRFAVDSSGTAVVTRSTTALTVWRPGKTR